MSQKRRQLLLKIIPQRKKTSKKLKHQMIQDIYYRASSMPQKRQTHFDRNKFEDDKKQNSYKKENTRLNTYQNQIKQQQQQANSHKISIPHKIIQRKNRSLPKYISQIVNVSTQDGNAKQNLKNWDHSKTKVKNFSKKQKQISNQTSQKYPASNYKYEINNLESMLNKKRSNKLVREQFLRNQTLFQNSPSTKVQNKQNSINNKFNNLKYAFQNRKFTNLTKYKPSFTSKTNEQLGFGNQNETFAFQKQKNKNAKRMSKQNSKKRMKTQTQTNDNMMITDQIKNQTQNSQLNDKIILDLDLNLYLNPQVNSKSPKNQIQTLQHIYQRVVKIYKDYLQLKQKKSIDNTQIMIDFQHTSQKILLKQCLKQLKKIQNQVGSNSKKTLIFMGEIFYELKQYNDCIFYLENVLYPVNYNILAFKFFNQSHEQIVTIDNGNKQKNQNNEINNSIDFSKVYIILAQSYRRTQNYLCSLKIMNFWQSNLVYKSIYKDKIYQNKFNQSMIKQKRKRTISHLQEPLLNRQKFRKHSSNTYYSSQKLQDPFRSEQKHFISQLNSDDKIHISLKNNNVQDSIKRNQTIQEQKHKKSLSKIRKESTDKKSSFLYSNYKLNPSRSRQLSIKTLNSLNFNENNDIKNEKQDFLKIKIGDLTRYQQKQKFAQGYLVKARIQYQLKYYESSIQDYLKSLTCQLSNVQAALQVGTIYYKIGKREKSIRFLQQFLQDYMVNERKSIQAINQIRYHLGVIQYKSGKYEESFQSLKLIRKQNGNQSFLSQIYFYQAMNLIKMERIFDFSCQLKQNQALKNIDQILICLQKCIDYRTSQFYVLSAYFLKIYILIFKIKHYYGAQYQIDRMKVFINRNKFNQENQQYQLLQKNLKKSYNRSLSKDYNRSSSKNQKLNQNSNNQSISKQIFDYKNISVQPLINTICLQDLISFTQAIICILKLKLNKGLKILSNIQNKIVKIQKNVKFSQIVSIQNDQKQNNTNESKININSYQVLKLVYQFKYYAFYAKRQYQKAMKYITKIMEIQKIIINKNGNHDLQSLRESLPQQSLQSINKQSIQSLNKDTFQQKQQKIYMFQQQNDTINYLVLKSLILMENLKFQDALAQIRILQSILSPIRSSSKNLFKKVKSNQNNKRSSQQNQKYNKQQNTKNMDSLQTINTSPEYKKQKNYFNTIKSVCYILLYKYLQKNSQKQVKHYSGQKSNKKSPRKNNEIIIEESSNNNSKLQKQNLDIELHQQNKQILLAAQDILSQCLICDKENYEILYLISFIHYQLNRYESALNYIRQAIELSDDHMIKHYYLKANLKLLLAKYDQAVKDYSNAITVYKEIEKQKNQNQHNKRNQNLSATDILQAQISRVKRNHNPLQAGGQTLNSYILSSKTDTISSSDQQNEYYQQQQQMYYQIYLHRAIAYLKYSYLVINQTKTVKKQGKYQEMRQNIINLKSSAVQDIKQYFSETLQRIKKKPIKNHQSNTFNIKQGKMNNQSNLLTITNNQQSNLLKYGKYLKLLLHTQEVQLFVQLNKSYTSQLNIKLVTEEQLMVYFYIAKQLNNCLIMMDKLIKRYYLSSQTNKNNTKKQRKNNSKNKYDMSNNSLQNDKFEPYFKSKKQTKYQSLNKRSTSYYTNSSKSPKESKEKSNHRYHHQSVYNKGFDYLSSSNNSKAIQYKTSLNFDNKQQSKQESSYNKQKIKKLSFDKKILSALKDSSSNLIQDYQSALISLLEQLQRVNKQILIQKEINQSQGSNKPNYSDFQGQIFKYADLLFFIGVLYYLIEDYQNCIGYFVKSYNNKLQANQLFSIKKLISTVSQIDQNDQQSINFNKQISLQNMKNFEQIYQNRIYSKEEIQYNIGIAYLLSGDYNKSYQYLQMYEPFVQIIQETISGKINKKNLNQQNNIKSRTKKNITQDLQLEKQPFNSKISTEKKQNKKRQKTQQSEKQQVFDQITPFPTHNRLCSIYPQKQISDKQFSISFCLPKIQLPLLNIFSPDQIEAAQIYHYKHSKEPKHLFSNLDRIQENNQVQLSNYTVNTKDNVQSQQKEIESQKFKKFTIKKSQFDGFIDLINLKDIQMKPNAPWIKKDRQQRCIKFTDNLINQSFDLRTQCNTQRKTKQTSQKQMFGNNKKGSSRKKIQNQKPGKRGQGKKQTNTKKRQDHRGQRQKQKQKQINKRYQTIDNNQ